MDSLYLLQFACFIFMLINALVLGITHLHMKWVNRRYEWSRWLILAGMTGLAVQYLLQMLLGFRAKSDDLGAVFNILVYTPCIITIAMGIYNIEATHANRRKMKIVCACIYAAIIALFCIGYSNCGSPNIGNWLYAMLVLFGANVAYCIYMIMIEMRKRKKMLELMTGNDMLPYVRYARASVFALFFSTLTMPFAILSTTLLYIIGPLALLSILFFNLSFVALGYNYVPTEELLDKEVEECAAQRYAETSNGGAFSETSSEVEASVNKAAEDGNPPLESALTDERKAIIEEKLQKWCLGNGYKDTAVNMLTLSDNIDITRAELTLYFDKCLGTTFRIWLANIRFEAAKTMMRRFPEYSNDIISAECGFSSRTYLYKIFKEKTGNTPTEWRTGVSTS